MKSLTALPLHAVLALAKQQFDELFVIRPLERLVQGDRGEPSQSKRVESLLQSLYTTSVRVRDVFQSRLARQDTTAITLSPGHAEFLRERLLPNIGAIEQAYFADDPLLLELLVGQEESSPSSAYRGMRDAVWFTAEYTNIMMDENDDRRSSVDAVFDLVEQPWFAPDQWLANLRALRPVILEIEEGKIPLRIRARLSEVHRSFTYGAWMATMALSRAVAEFALIERAPSIGYKVTQLDRNGDEEFLSLNRLITNAVKVSSALEDDLETLREAGNRILHHKRRQNVIPSPKILREEALKCVLAVTKVLEVLYSRCQRT